jgi:sugar phosphate isomerase/epimerase
MSIKIGAQLYTLRDFCQTLDGFADTLARVADMGYTTVQMSGCCEFEPEWFKEQLKKNGLTCELTHFELEDIVGDPEKIVADHNVYGCKHIGIGYMPQPYRGDVKKVEEFCNIFDEASTRIHELGSQLMYHNHWFEYDDRGDGKNYMEMIAERFTPEQLGFTLDTYWVAFADYDVVSEIERLSGRLPRVHLKDMEILTDGTKRYCPVGSGVIDFEKALVAFEKAGTEVAFVEQDECFERDPFTCLKMSYDYLKSIGYN